MRRFPVPQVFKYFLHSILDLHSLIILRLQKKSCFFTICVLYLIVLRFLEFGLYVFQGHKCKVRVYNTHKFADGSLWVWGETWSLTLRQEVDWGCFENRVLRKIFGPRRHEVTERWKKLHNGELNNLYFSPSISRMINSRKMWLGRQVARMGRRGMRVDYCWESQKERDY
jgi:hypothetical protein